MKTVFLDSQTFSPQISLNAIEQQVKQFVHYPLTSPDQVLSRCSDADIVITNKVVLDSALINKLPSVKLICVAATGTNNIDLPAAANAGIVVTNVADYADTAVAQYIFAQLLNYFQNISHHNQNTLQGKWHRSDTFCFLGQPINELAGKTIGLIGYGHIAKRVASIAQAFGMQVLISERKNAHTCRKDRVAFSQVLAQADIISLHCPLNKDTYQLINQQSLQQMKSNAILINTARGDIVDEAALINALQNRQIAQAIVDVVSKEPPTKSCLLANQQLDNLVVTAHIAWASMQAQQRIIDGIATNIEHYLTKQPINVVNPLT